MKYVTTLAALAGVTLGSVATADAQTRQFGNTAPVVAQALANFGFEPQFRLIDRELVRTVVAACRGQDMYRVSVNILGAVSTKERLGRCDIEGATAEVAPRRRPALNKKELVTKLTEQGYSRIRWMDDQLPRYVVRACDARRNRMELVLNRRGEIRRSQRNGACQPRQVVLGQDDVRKRLRREGFDQIRFETKRAPFGVLACLQNQRRRLIVDRRGEVVSNQPSGRCEVQLNAKALTARLIETGLRRVEVKPDGRRFVAEACDGDARVRLVLNRRGEERRRTRTGNCESKRVSEVLSTLRSRGGEKLDLFVEGCFRNTRYRWSFDRYGERTGRRAIGRC